MASVYCQLGHLAFQRREYFQGLEIQHKWEFAEQAHIEGKPGLQAIGDALDTYTLDMVFHHLWCDPGASLGKLQEVCDRKQAQALTLGTVYKGLVVVTELTETWQHTRPDGALLYAIARVTLKEFVDPAPLETKKQAAKAAAPALKVKDLPGWKARDNKPATSAAKTTPRKTKPKPGVAVKKGTPPNAIPSEGKKYDEIPLGAITRT